MHVTKILIKFIYIYGLKVLLTTPTTPTDRMKAIVQAAEGFIYLVRFLFMLDNISSFFCL